MDKKDFDRLKKALEDVVSFEKSGEPLPYRTTKYVGAIRVEVKEKGRVEWSLEEQLKTLKDLDISNCKTYAATLGAVMKHLGQGDEGMAELIGIPVSTLRAWKQGRREPSGPGRRLFEVSVQNPQIMWDVVRESEEAYG